MIRLIFAALAALVLASPATAQNPETFEEQLDLFLDWFPGRYDNGLQVEQQQAANTSQDARIDRRHVIIRRVDLPRFGALAFYAEQYRDADPDKVAHQHIYIATRDFDNEAIRLRVYIPHEPDKLLGAYSDASLLDGFDPEMTRNWASCDWLWRWDDGEFRAKTVADDCPAPFEAVATLRADALLLGRKSAHAIIAKRVRPFVCSGQFPKADPVSEVWLHDQGGRFGMITPREAMYAALQRRYSEARGETLELRLTNSDAVDDAIVINAAGDVTALSFDFAGANVDCELTPERLYDDGRGG